MGPRNCIGKSFAEVCFINSKTAVLYLKFFFKIEMKVIISKIIQNFEIILDPTQSFDIYEALTTKPKDGTRCKIRFKKDS